MTPPLLNHQTKDDAATRSWLTVVRAYHLCSELLALRLGALGVRTAEHEILMNLRREPGLSQQVLAARCFTAKSHISQQLTELASRGWVKRESDPADGRAKRLVLTTSGAKMAARTAAVQVEVVALMTAGATPADLAQVRAVMSEACLRLFAALEQSTSKLP
jgi:DNA-binding MarR family transcriptional regulator